MRLIDSIYAATVKKFYGRFNGKLFPLVAVPGSYIALLYLLLIKKKNQVIVLPTSALGDFIYMMSFIPLIEDKCRRQQQELVLYASERYKEIIEHSQIQTRIILLKHLGVKHLLLLMLSFSPYSPRSVKIARNFNIMASIPSSYKRVLSRNNIVGTRCQLSHIFDVALNPIFYHKQPVRKVKVIENFEAEKKRICIINPYSYSMHPSSSLYEDLCRVLIQRGFVVYTNVVGNQQCVKGTKELRCSIDELFSIAAQIPLVVSVRSGILDYLIPANANMFVIYENWNSACQGTIQRDIAKNYSLKEWSPRGVVKELYWNERNDESKIFEEFCSFLDALTVEL